jgi:hypothetical protein
MCAIVALHKAYLLHIQLAMELLLCIAESKEVGRDENGKYHTEVHLFVCASK